MTKRIVYSLSCFLFITISIGLFFFYKVIQIHNGNYMTPEEKKFAKTILAELDKNNDIEISSINPAFSDIVCSLDEYNNPVLALSEYSENDAQIVSLNKNTVIPNHWRIVFYNSHNNQAHYYQLSHNIIPFYVASHKCYPTQTAIFKR